METSYNIALQHPLENMINEAFEFSSLHGDNKANSSVEDGNNNDEMHGQTMDEATIEFYKLFNDGY